MALPKEYKAVFVAGLLEKIFPQETIQDPFFKDAERRVLNRNGVVLDEQAWRLAGERYFFYMAVTRAKEKLILSYAHASMDGRPALPSFFVEEVRKIFGTLKVTRRSLEQFLPEPGEWATEKEKQRGLAELQPKAAQQENTAQIKDQEILKQFSESKIFSATKLEAFSACAFKYFASKMLFLNEPFEGREHLIMGNVLHATLELFFKNLSQSRREDVKLWKDAPALRRKMTDALETILAKENYFKHEPLYRQRIYRKKMERLLDQFAVREAQLSQARGLVPTYFELSFGNPKKSDRDYLKVKDASREFWLEGKIDRIDVLPGEKKALVIDYKKSARSISIRSRLEKGLEFQLPIYLLFLEKELGFEALGAELRLLQDSKEEGLYPDSARQALGLHALKKTLSAEEFEALRRQAHVQIRQVVERLRGGDIRVKSKSCEHCEYDAVCRFEKWKLIYG
jgi:ATP-dependent helicase/nuclease subunit B